MSIDTYVIKSVAIHDTAETAVPTPLPAFGEFIDWADYAGWEQCPFEFTADPFEFTRADENALIVKPPARPAKTEIIRNAFALDSIAFTAYEFGGKVFDWATNVSEVGGVYSFSNIHTRKTMIIEYGKIGLLYLPSVEITFEVPMGGVWALGTQIGRVDVFGTDSNPAGFQWVQLQ